MKKLLTFFLTALLTFSVGWAATVTDVLEASDFTATTTSYTNFSGVSKPSGAVYAGNTAKNGSSIQLRSTSNSGIVSTASGGKIKSVTINIAALTTADKTIDVYGKNSAYTSASNLYSSSDQGTKLGSVTQTVGGVASSGTVTVTGDYEYIGIRSKSGAIYLASVSIEWETGGSTVETCATPTFSPAAGTYTEAQNVTISTTTSGASIYYTTDNSTPSSTNGTLYNGAINVSSTTTIKAIAVKTGNNDSQVAEATYTIETSVSTIYRKVTSTDALTTGDYLIVYEDGSLAFDGNLTTLDAVNNTQAVTIDNHTITTSLPIYFTYNASTGTLKSASGYYIGRTSNSNGMNTSQTDIYTNSITFDDSGNANITSSGGPNLRYNKTSGQTRFRFFTSAQQSIQLYKKDSNDPTLLATPPTLTLTDIPYDGNSTSGTFTLTGANLTQNVTMVLSGAEGFSISPSTSPITPDGNGSVNQEYTVTYSGSSTSEVTATVTFTCGNLTETVTVTAKKATPPPASLTVSPNPMTINDTDNTLTITGENITGNINASLANNTDWYLTSNQFSNTGGTTNVVYNGRDLSATNTVSVSANDVQTIDVPVNYLADLYIVTDNGYTGQWNFNNGTSMTYNNGVYTASFTAERANTYILFARKLGNGVDWNTRFVFGPDSGGDYGMDGDYTSWYIDLYDDDPIRITNTGTYIITINANDGTFTIAKEVVNEGDFVLVTDATQLNTGDEVIIVNSGTAGDTDAKAMSTTQNSNNRGVTTVAVSATQKVTATDDTQIFTLEGDATGWYFKTVNGETQGYIYAASNSSNHLKTEATADNNAKATISVTSEGVATIVFQGTNSRNHLRYNSSNNPPIYSCYASTSTQAKPYLYKRSAGTVVTAPVITPEGGTSNKHFESFNVTITAAEGCSIYYTTDGSTPTISSTPYSVPFLLPYGSEPTTVKAIAVDGQGTVSAVASMTYYWDRVSVTINPASQHVTGDVNVTITATPSDATVTYTINGGAVQTYNGEFIVPVNETNSPVTVEVTATKGESTATTSATYILVDASATLYTKVTSADQIVPGNKYILVYEDTPEALNGVTSGGTGVEVAWATQGSVINVAETNALQFTLGGSANAATLSYDLGSTTYYLEPGNAPNLDLTDQATEGYEWTITESDGGYVLTWGNYVLRYNNGAQAANGRFRIYQPNASTGQLSGHPVYLYVQGAYVTLSDLVQTGIETKKYTITNQLHAVKVTWDKNEGKFAIFAKDNQEYANKSYPTADQESYLIRYQNGSFINEVAQEDYDQSNWIEILIPSDVTQKDPNSPNYQSTLDGLKETFENKMLAAGSITGKYVDALNPTIEVTINPSAESTSTYTPNIYCTANFPMYNFENGGAQGNDGIYFMMDPKPHEFCKVVWAYYGGSGNYFIAPQREGDEINGHDFKGSFLANMSLCEDIDVVYEDVAPYFSNSTEAGLLYGFNAIVRKTEANQANGAPHRIQPSDSGTETNPAYVVYPLNASSTSSDNVVDVKELLGGKTIESIHYYNTMGMEGKTPFEGINIVVTRYTDGSTSTYKVMK